jgi:integrase
MKLPNGFGTVYRLTGNRRKPYVIKKFIDGKQKIVGFSETYIDGISFLVEYNKSPNIFNTTNITFSEVYHLFIAEKFPTISNSTRTSYTNVFKHSETLHDKSFISLKLKDLQSVILSIKKAGAGYSTQKKCRNMFHQLFSYAIKYDIAYKDYSCFITIDKDDHHIKKLPFTTRQINKLKKSGLTDAELVLILCYTGLRSFELRYLKPSNINLRNKYLVVGKSKTLAGTNRIIPIHDYILPFIEARMNNTYILGNALVSASSFTTTFKTVMDKLKLKHTPHECRHTFATILNDKGANPITIKKLMGHSSTDITVKHYTHKNLRELRKAIKLLP